tara:strand:- start:159 stop:272 length:114 start_codon:yes stop_codon:yes gene_type:complete
MVPLRLATIEAELEKMVFEVCKGCMGYGHTGYNTEAK